MGSTAFILRITFFDTGKNACFPSMLYRNQFPIYLAFAITINKSQGQDFENLGLCIFKPIFSHGELYVALSTPREESKLKASAKHNEKLRCLWHLEPAHWHNGSAWRHKNCSRAWHKQQTKLLNLL